MSLCSYHYAALPGEQKGLAAPGVMVTVEGNRIHVLGVGDPTAPTVLLMAGAATIAPVYDFQPLMSGLENDFRVVVVEKPGYGYSDLAGSERGLDTRVEEMRSALRQAEQPPPYILAPHSMSGLEAIWWADRYPEEVAGIVGLDMSTPEAYEKQDRNLVAAIAATGHIATRVGTQRIPGLYPGMYWSTLSEADQEQQRLLLYRNAGNVAQVQESRQVFESAAELGTDKDIDPPMLLFASDGRDLGPDWLKVQKQLALRTGANLVMLDCGHAVHHCAPDRISHEMRTFALSISDSR